MKPDSLVSVIVPLYNTAKQLARCIESILNQTYGKLEIILVDDGSTDKSACICDYYAQKDARIKVFHTFHGGVSHARNIGLSNATGQYVQFVDSDDYVDAGMTELLVESIRKYDSELVICGYRRLLFDNVVGLVTVNSGSGEVGKDTIMRMLAKCDTYCLFPIPSNKLYAMRNIIENNLRFEEGLSYGEDIVFNLEFIRYAKYFSLVDEALYNYVDSRSDSLTKIVHKDLWEIRKNVFLLLMKIYAECDYYYIYEKKLFSHLAARIGSMLGKIFAFDSAYPHKLALEILNKITDDPLVKNDILKLENIDFITRLMIFCMKKKVIFFLPFIYRFKSRLCKHSPKLFDILRRINHYMC